MTTLAEPTRSTSEGGRLSGLVRLTLRQHRAELIALAAWYVGLSVFLFLDRHPAAFVDLPDMLVWLTPLATGLLLGSVLVAREYEQHTHLLVWSQDVGVGRWLLTKAAVLAVAQLPLCVLLGFATQAELARTAPIGMFWGDSAAGPYGLFGFDESVPMQVGYGLFALALGIAAGARLRRTMPANGLFILLYFGVRIPIADYLRPLLIDKVITPVRMIFPGNAIETLLRGSPVLPLGAHHVFIGLLTTNGTPVEFLTVCERLSTSPGYLDCLRRNGIAAGYNDYQPVGRLPVFHGIELAIYLVLSAALMVVAYRRLRRRTVI